MTDFFNTPFIFTQTGLSFSPMTISPGIYQHYKGQEYQVYEVAHHSETEEALVVYRCLYGKYDLWVRPLKMFLEEVTVDGALVPRFKFIRDADSKGL